MKRNFIIETICNSEKKSSVFNGSNHEVLVQAAAFADGVIKDINEEIDTCIYFDSLDDLGSRDLCDLIDRQSEKSSNPLIIKISDSLDPGTYPLYLRDS